MTEEMLGGQHQKDESDTDLSELGGHGLRLTREKDPSSEARCRASAGVCSLGREMRREKILTGKERGKSVLTTADLVRDSALIGTLDPGRFGICTRTGLCPARSGNNATQIAEMAVKQQPPDMSELLRSWADNGIHPLALRLNGCAGVSKLNEPLLPVLR